MKFAFTCFLLVFSFLSFAINPHEGGGGNVCIPENGNGRLQAVDKIYFPLSVASKGRDLERFISPLKSTISFGSQPNLIRSSLIESRAGKEVEKLILKIQTVDHAFFGEIYNLFLMLGHVDLLNSEFNKAYGDFTDAVSSCRPGTLRSVIMTSHDGHTVVSHTAWNRLDFETQKIIILHETLRIAQLFRPWLSAYSDLDIYRLTMLIYTGNLKELKTEPMVQDFHEMKGYANIPDVDVAILRLKAFLESETQPQTLFLFSLILADHEAAISSDQWKSRALSQRILRLKESPAYAKKLKSALEWSKN